MGSDHHKLSREKTKSSRCKTKGSLRPHVPAAKETARREDNHPEVSSCVPPGSEVTWFYACRTFAQSTA